MPILWFVSQISPPMRILLVGAVVFLAAWFTVLRPKAAEVPPATTSTTTTTAPSATPAATSKTDSATTTAPDVKPAEAPAIPGEALAKLPKDVAGALKARKVLVLGVIADGETKWRPLSDDDRYVRNSLRDVNRYDGGVLVKSVPLSKLSTYGAVVNDLGVNQTPSVVVIDGNLKGKVLTGYVDRIAINQVIADARGASREPDVTGAFRRDANALCGDFTLRIEGWSLPTVRGGEPLSAAYKRGALLIRSYKRKVSRLEAPAQYRALKRDWVKFMGEQEKRAFALAKAAKTKRVSDDDVADAMFDERLALKLDRRFDDAGLTNCAENRRS